MRENKIRTMLQLTRESGHLFLAAGVCFASAFGLLGRCHRGDLTFCDSSSSAFRVETAQGVGLN